MCIDFLSPKEALFLVVTPHLLSLVQSGGSREAVEVLIRERNIRGREEDPMLTLNKSADPFPGIEFGLSTDPGLPWDTPLDRGRKASQRPHRMAPSTPDGCIPAFGAGSARGKLSIGLGPNAYW